MRVAIDSAARPNRAARPLTSSFERINALAIDLLQKNRGGSARWKGLGILVSTTIAVLAILALMHALKHVHYREVWAIVTRTNPGAIALALVLVVVSYASLTLYDQLALRTIRRPDIPYRIAALASFTSYPIAHGMGLVALISPVISYRIYSFHGLGAIDVANICFLTGLTFWLGNLTALAFSLSYAPAAISLLDYLPAALNRGLAVPLLVGILAFLVWSWRGSRRLGTARWPVQLPSGPMVLLQIAIGLFDLGAAALAMDVLIPAGSQIGFVTLTTVFIAATLLGFASHTPAGIGVFDAAILVGLGGDDKEPLIAALLMFRLLYHLLPFVIALVLLGGVELRRSWRPKLSN